MRYMGLNELREKYLSFFESKGHLRLPSFSLVPEGNASMLLIPAGMAPLKPYFSGEQEPPCRRVTTCQKCVRTIDIDRVGKTARHASYFEMLGNFSFGDYFKHEAITWSWEFCTQVLEIPRELLWASVYEEDEEAYAIWRDVVGMDESHIVRLGKDDNFWEIGAGPCGPCSEIYVDRGADKGCGSPDCKPGCDCDRFMEIWNNVFTQFDNDGNGNYTTLKHKNIDTGMGLERLACFMQGVDSLFEVDTVRNIMAHVSRLTGVSYGDDAQKDVSLRVITDHIRSTAFLVCDGVRPSNEGRGYVLRRLLRRAARHGKLLGMSEPFLYKVCETVAAENAGAYPELTEKLSYITKVIRMEEEGFDKTIDSGLVKLGEMMDGLRAAGKTVLSGEEAFRLYDTYGFPIDLTVEILAEAKMTYDEESFALCMKEQRERARAARAALGDLGWAGSAFRLSDLPATKFTGYAESASEAVVLAIFAGNEAADTVFAGDEAMVVLDATPFYGEGGGQTGDMGVITGPNGCVFEVKDTKKTPDGRYLHYGVLVTGELAVGDTVCAKLDLPRRRAIARAHSATHLLQKALRTVLGAHVEQAGSYVTPDNLRFDFSHFAAMTDEEISEVERIVNEKILEGMCVRTDEMPIEEARKLGAMALFGEKYGAVVRVVRMGEFSTEFCGGTHLDNTAKAGLFRIVSESSVAAGVRRIEGRTGMGVLEYEEGKEALLSRAQELLKTNEQGMLRRIEQLNAENRELTREAERLSEKLASAQTDGIYASARELGGVRAAALRVDGMKNETLRAMTDQLKDKYPDLVAVLAAVADGKISFFACCGKAAAAKGAHAGNILKAISKIAGGGGGGRPDSATAGGRDPSKLDEALEAVYPALGSMLK